MTKEVRLEFDGPIATITNDNPEKHNAFDDDMDLQLFDDPRPSCRSGPTCGRSSGAARASRSRRVATSASIGGGEVELTHHELMTPRPPRASCRCSTSTRRSSSPCRAGRSAASFQRALLCDIRIAAEGARFMLPEVDPRRDPRHRRRGSPVPDLRPRRRVATWCSPAGRCRPTRRYAPRRRVAGRARRRARRHRARDGREDRRRRRRSPSRWPAGCSRTWPSPRSARRWPTS